MSIWDQLKNENEMPKESIVEKRMDRVKRVLSKIGNRHCEVFRTSDSSQAISHDDSPKDMSNILNAFALVSKWATKMVMKDGKLTITWKQKVANQLKLDSKEQTITVVELKG